MAITFPLDHTQPFALTLPANASVAEDGSVVADLTAAASGAALDDLSNVDPATGRTALGVPATADVVLKTDVQVFGPMPLSLTAASGATIRIRAPFAGLIVGATCTLSGATVATGAASATIAVDGVTLTTNQPISFAIGQAAGAVLDVRVISGGFVDDAAIVITPGGTNSAATVGWFTVEYRRA